MDARQLRELAQTGPALRAALGREKPRDGETWRANFFRIDRHPQHGDEYSAWQPTMKDPADFHIAECFGTLTFAV